MMRVLSGQKRGARSMWYLSIKLWKGWGNWRKAVRGAGVSRHHSQISTVTVSNLFEFWQFKSFWILTVQICRYKNKYIRAPLKPHETIVLWWSEGFEGVSSVGPPWLPRAASLSDSCASYSSSLELFVPQEGIFVSCPISIVNVF